MASEELRQSWKRTEAHLRAALAAQDDLPDAARRETLELIDHNELGVAFESVMSAVADGDIALTPVAREALAAAAAEMGLLDDYRGDLASAQGGARVDAPDDV